MSNAAIAALVEAREQATTNLTTLKNAIEQGRERLAAQEEGLLSAQQQISDLDRALSTLQEAS